MMKPFIALLMLAFLVGLVMTFVTLSTSAKLLSTSDNYAQLQQQHQVPTLEQHQLRTSKGRNINEEAPDDGAYFATIREWPIPMRPEIDPVDIINITSDADNTTTSTTSTTTIQRRKTHWCIIGKHSSSKPSRRFFMHFPHAAENLLPCWSWWRRWDAVELCGVVLLDGLSFPPNSWHYQLMVEELKCDIQSFGAYAKDVNRTHPLRERGGPDDTNLYYNPSLYWKNPRYGRINYIEQPSDAWALRRRFISDDEIVALKGSTTTIQIGIIQRVRSRSITNLPDIIELLRQSIPDSNITVTMDMSPRIQDQATWFATKDVIIGAHGAAMMNSIFVLPKTIVMQLYPPNYFFQSLEPLIEAVGGIALDWYEGTDPVYDWRQQVKSGKNNMVRDEHITVLPPSQVVDPILFTMGRKPTPSGWVNLLGVEGTNWSKTLSWMA